jgi:hypothetical protein
MVREADEEVKAIVTRFRERHPEGRFLVFGDHGMLDVERTLSVMPMVRDVARRAGLNIGRDFDLWLDSTLVRMWFRADRALAVLTEWMSTDATMAAHGQVLSAEKCAALHVPKPGEAYGDLMWLAEPGVLLWPDYYHHHVQYMGMHGYETHHAGQQGYAVWHHPERARVESEEIEGIDICPLVADLLEVPIPKDCEGVHPGKR